MKGYLLFRGGEGQGCNKSKKCVIATKGKEYVVAQGKL